MERQAHAVDGSSLQVREADEGSRLTLDNPRVFQSTRKLTVRCDPDLSENIRAVSRAIGNGST